MYAYVHALTATITTCDCSHVCPLQQVFLTLRQGNTTVKQAARVPTNKEIDHITRFVLVTFGKGHANLLCTLPITPVLSIENLAAINTPGSVSKKAQCTIFLKNRTKPTPKTSKIARIRRVCGGRVDTLQHIQDRPSTKKQSPWPVHEDRLASASQRATRTGTTTFDRTFLSDHDRPQHWRRHSHDSEARCSTGTPVHCWSKRAPNFIPGQKL